MVAGEISPQLQSATAPFLGTDPLCPVWDARHQRFISGVLIMGITFHTQGQGKKAVESEALALEQILALAVDLTKDSSLDQIKTVLGKAAKAPSARSPRPRRSAQSATALALPSTC